MKLNLALAYIDQGDVESACSILNEVIDGGDEEQKQEARQLLAKIA
jgi:pilus assembly protein FimV